MKSLIGAVLMGLGGVIAIIGIIIGSLISIWDSTESLTRIKVTLPLVIITGFIGIALMILGLVLVCFIN